MGQTTLLEKARAGAPGTPNVTKFVIADEAALAKVPAALPRRPKMPLRRTRVPGRRLERRSWHR